MGSHAELVQVFIETLASGYRELRREEIDVELVDIWLEDYVGRRIPTTVHRSAVLLMVPSAGDIGGFVFEPVITQQGVTRDPISNKPIWGQRVTLSHYELQDMVESAVRQQSRGPRLVVPT